MLIKERVGDKVRELERGRRERERYLDEAL
jgi:hypothetical protein